MSEISAEREKTRSEVAEYLREFADKLDSGTGSATEQGQTTRSKGETARSGTNVGADDPNLDRDRGDHADGGSHGAGTDQGSGKLTLVVGNDSATINPPETVGFTVEVNSDSSLMDSGKTQHASFDLTWDADAVEEDDELRIE